MKKVVEKKKDAGDRTIMKIGDYALMSNNCCTRETCVMCFGLCKPRIPCDIFHKGFGGTLCEDCIKTKATHTLIQERHKLCMEFDEKEDMDLHTILQKWLEDNYDLMAEKFKTNSSYSVIVRATADQEKGFMMMKQEKFYVPYEKIIEIYRDEA